MNHDSRSSAGFTLLEVVIALIVMAIVSTAFVPMIRLMQQRTAQSAVSVSQMYALQNQMEQLVQAFEQEMEDGGTAASFRNQVDGLLAAGFSLADNRLVERSGENLVDGGPDSTLLLVGIRDASGYRLRRLFGHP